MSADKLYELLPDPKLATNDPGEIALMVSELVDSGEYTNDEACRAMKVWLGRYESLNPMAKHLTAAVRQLMGQYESELAEADATVADGISIEDLKH